MQQSSKYERRHHHLNKTYPIPTDALPQKPIRGLCEGE